MFYKDMTLFLDIENQIVKDQTIMIAPLYIGLHPAIIRISCVTPQTKTIKVYNLPLTDSTMITILAITHLNRLFLFKIGYGHNKCNVLINIM